MEPQPPRDPDSSSSPVSASASSDPVARASTGESTTNTTAPEVVSTSTDSGDSSPPNSIEVSSSVTPTKDSDTTGKTLPSTPKEVQQKKNPSPLQSKVKASVAAAATSVDSVAAAAAADAEALLASSPPSLSEAESALATTVASALLSPPTSDPSLVSLLATAAARTLNPPAVSSSAAAITASGAFSEHTPLSHAMVGAIPVANMVFAPLAAALASTALAFLIGLVKFILWTLVLALFAVWWGQGYILYVPTVMGRVGEKRQLRFNPPGARVPAEQGLTYEEYFLRTQDGVMLHAWFLPQPEGIRQTCPTVLYFHGNAGNVGNLLVSCRQMHRALRCNTLVLDYRGYGNSQGSPSEHGLQLDALAAAGFISRLAEEGRIAGDRVFLFGCSLGGAVALWLATQRPELFAGVVVENTFTSIEDMAIVLLSRVAPPGRLESPLRAGLHVFMTSHWRSIDRVPLLTIPSLFFSGLADDLVPPAHMRALYDAAPDPERGGPEKVFHAVEGGEHNTTFYQGGQAYYDAYYRFISRHSSKTK